MRRLLVAAAILLCPLTASAWTDAVVRSAHAEATVSPDGNVYVVLTLTVRVHGGWLEGIEIAGLDDGLELDEGYEAWAEDEDGRSYAPRIRIGRADRVQVSFPGSSPRRGELRIGLAYRATLAHDATGPLEGEDRVRVSWTLPGWRSGLDGVRVDLVVPPGSRAPSTPGEDVRDAELSTEVEVLSDRTVIHSWRAHLPRTVPWTVSAEVPASEMDAALRGAPVVHRPAPPPSAAIAPERDGSWFWIALAVLLGLLAFAKSVAVHRRARRIGVSARPLLLAPALVRSLGALVTAAAGGVLGATGHPRLALLAFALLSLSATYVRSGPPAACKLGAWRPVDRRWIRAASEPAWRQALRPSGLLDATTPLGLLHSLAWLLLPWLWPDPPVSFDILLLASVLPFPMLATGGRSSAVRGGRDALAALLGHTRNLRGLPEGVALRPVVHISVDGEVQELRIRTALEHRADGLLRLDLALAHQPQRGRWHVEARWLVLTRAGSPAEVAMQELTDGLEIAADRSRGGRRIVRCLALADLELLAKVVEALGTCPEAPEGSRGSAVPMETVRELPAPRAVGF